MPPISVLLVDDHTLFREGLISLLRGRNDIVIVGEASDGREALEKAHELMPDLILMDIRMPTMGGLEATRLIKRELPYVKIVMLTISEDDQDLFEAIKAGADGYIVKNVHAAELFRLIKGVFAGEPPISSTMAAKVLSEFIRQAREGQTEIGREGLTRREEEILRLIAEGATNRAIAARLNISESTVKKHLHNILDKLHLQNRVQLAIYALRDSLFSGVHTE